jgi:predicted nucleic-acid-binding protein
MNFKANKISYRAFNSYTNKCGDFEDVNKIPRELKRGDNNVVNYKKNALKRKDSRLAYKNRRNINKDWKDFNNKVI